MNNYSSTIKTRGFLYLEMKKASALYLQGSSRENIKRKALEDNIFLLNTENRRREIAATVLDRVSVLDQFLLERLVNGNLGVGKQIVLYSIMKTDRLFFEFMQEVFFEKLFLGDYILESKDFKVFFQRKAEQSKQMASWVEYTFYKLSQVYRKILLEAGLAKREKRKLKISRAVIEEDVARHIQKNGHEIYLKAVLGEA